MNILSMDQARNQGLRRYFTGVPCRNGHMAERYTCNGRCVECVCDRHSRYNEAHQGTRQAYDAEYRKTHQERIARNRAAYKPRQQYLYQLRRDSERQKGRERWAKMKREDPERYKSTYKKYNDLRLKKIEESRAVALGRPKPNTCECCGQTVDKIVWDHNHKTGEGRGWICTHCNVALGMVGDDLIQLQQLIEYLLRCKRG